MNIHNIPIRTEAGCAIRRAFEADPAFPSVLVEADYSQMELRLLERLHTAAVSISDSRDMYQQTAADLLGVEPVTITADERRVAKGICFGDIYGTARTKGA
jgi:DNA polymerase I